MAVLLSARFVPGERIDTTKKLQIVGLAANAPEWVQIETAYPDLRGVTSFRGRPRVDIFPTFYVHKAALNSIPKIAVGHSVVTVPPRAASIVLAVVHTRGNPVDEVRIYRSRS